MLEILKVGETQLYKWELGASRYLVNPLEGARLMNWYLTLADGTQRDLIYWPDYNKVGGEGFGDIDGGNPILFPFAGASFVDGKKGFWKSPSGEVLPYKMHGYAKDSTFKLDYADDFGFRAIFEPNAECKLSYPYDYEFSITYRFSEFGLNCEASLQNHSDIDIPWAIGYHFYFVMPWHDNLTRKNYRLVCDAKKAYNISEQGELYPVAMLDNLSFDSPHMHNRILTKFKTSNLSFGTMGGEEEVYMKMGTESKPEAGTCLITWARDEESPYYCVEPWLRTPNCAKKKMIAPKQKSVFSVDVSLI